jgi:predicted Fe-Mo cluster-binding NifX family protein
MKIALPIADGRLCMHFGHCEKFAILDVNASTNEIISEDHIDAPPHQPGLLPQFLADLGANFIIAGGMGSRAIGLFESFNIKVITGAPADSPRKVVDDFLNNMLEAGQNVCDH